MLAYANYAKLDCWTSLINVERQKPPYNDMSAPWTNYLLIVFRVDYLEDYCDFKVMVILLKPSKLVLD